MATMDFDRFWELYTDNFPPDEQRTRADQETLMENPLYTVEPIIRDDEVVGFFTYWSFDGFKYGEHIAVNDSCKGQGLGSKVLGDFIRRHGKMVIEIVPPQDEISRRRKGFYERLGFMANPYPYVMPKLSENGHSMPSVLMSYPAMLSPGEFAAVRDQLYTVVYEVHKWDDPV